MKIKIPYEVVVCNGLSYKQACKVLGILEGTNYENCNFSMIGEADKIGWTIMVRFGPVVREFLDDPDKFYVDISDLGD